MEILQKSKEHQATESKRVEEANIALDMSPKSERLEVRKRSDSKTVTFQEDRNQIFTPEYLEPLSSEDEPEETNDDSSEDEFEVVECSIVKAKYPFKARSDRELTISVDDEVAVFEKEESGWWRGKNLLTEEFGWFPSNYIENTDKIVGLPGFRKVSYRRPKPTTPKKLSNFFDNSDSESNEEDSESTSADEKSEEDNNNNLQATDETTSEKNKDEKDSLEAEGVYVHVQ